MRISVAEGLGLRSALRPVDTLIRGARRSGAALRPKRLPQPGTEDEIGRLANTLNEMLDRLAQVVEAERRFTTDVAHELQSPLSQLRAEPEIVLGRGPAAAEYGKVLRSALEEVEGLSRSRTIG
jgi:two-component system, OmpR family, sensor kinase